MEAVFAPSEQQTTIPTSYSTRQMMKNPSGKKKKNNNTRSFISRSSTDQNLAPINNSNIIHGGGLFFGPPPSLSFSFPPPLSVFNPHLQQIQRIHDAPPLLPLPVSRPLYTSLPPASRSRDLSCPPATSRKTNRPRNQSLTPKKPSKQPTKRSEEPKLKDPKAESLIVESSFPLGPDPNELPKNVSKVLSPTSSVSGNNRFSSTVALKDLDSFSGSVFTLSPPPSSLPLPKFSIRPKLSCNKEVSGTDDGATDNLRRMLRLR